MTQFVEDFKKAVEEVAQEIFDAGHSAGYLLGRAEGNEKTTDPYMGAAENTNDSASFVGGCGDPTCPCNDGGSEDPTKFLSTVTGEPISWTEADLDDFGDDFDDHVFNTKIFAMRIGQMFDELDTDLGVVEGSVAEIIGNLEQISNIFDTFTEWAVRTKGDLEQAQADIRELEEKVDADAVLLDALAVRVQVLEGNKLDGQG